MNEADKIWLSIYGLAALMLLGFWNWSEDKPQPDPAPVKKEFKPAAPDSVYTEAEQRVFDHMLKTDTI